MFLGHALAGNDNPIAPSVKFAIDPKPKYTYDPEKAKSLLKKAGMPNLKVDLSVADAAFNGAVDAAVLYQQHAKAAGIDLNIIREPNDGYWDNWGGYHQYYGNPSWSHRYYNGYYGYAPRYSYYGPPAVAYAQPYYYGPPSLNFNIPLR